MKAKKKIIYVLELTEKQAMYIKILVQNSIGHPDEEDIYRHNFGSSEVNNTEAIRGHSRRENQGCSSIEIKNLRKEIWDMLDEIPI
jgi:hypothetical protein